MNTGPDDSAVSGSLPPVVSNYLAASDRDDIDAVVACFTNDAVVLDEDRHWRGAAEIRQWRENVAAAFEYTVAIIGSEALGEVDGAQRYAVYTHLEGNFPGGQVDLTNRFTLRGDLITALEIVPTAVTS
ncbi:MAG TPA: nuclear transport factor 2 family protein [Mycobacterium sp.]|nr:nuclear transport factor 2 family protein [Mycobacterium sp.]